MILFKWTDDLSVGYGKIDEQHKELIDRLNKFLTAVFEGRGRENLKEMLNFLDVYVKEHFEEEEKMMKEYDYPEAESHMSAHRGFIESFQDIVHKVWREEINATTVIDAQKKMVDWLRNHIQKVDKKLGAFLKEKEKD